MKTPGYGKSLAAKYGARLTTSDYQADEDYDKDHFMIAFAMLDHIRTTNIFALNLAQPYADPLASFGSGLGTLPGLNLIDRNLKSGNGSSEHARRWAEPTLEPYAPGREYTLSELVLVAYVTGETTINGWSDGEPSFTSSSGTDVFTRERILQNKHPAYEQWREQPFGPGDVGKTFVSVEVGLLPEAFSPSQGTPRKLPEQTLRLLTGGQAYRGGLSEDRGLRVNGIPLQLSGQSEPTNTAQQGPILSTVQEGIISQANDFPVDWQSHGGPGGARLFSFGTFTINEDQEGWHGRQFLSNGSGPLAGWYCQTPIVIEKGTSLSFAQEEPIQIALYTGGRERANTGNLERLFNIRFAQPGESFEVPGPEADISPQYKGWTRRMRTAARTPASDPFQITEPTGDEVTKGLSVSHGDYRHVALKRVIPSEMFSHHPSAKSRRNSHSISWATRGGTSIEATSRQGPAEFGRSLVDGVDYNTDVLPDFVQDASDRASFAPLLGTNYRFPIDPTITRDFDNGLGNAPDGPYIYTSDDGEDKIAGSSIFNPLAPYFNGASSIADTFGLEHHFARRMAPSPVAFGSLPSASQANAPWTCLLFRPNMSDPATMPHLGEAGNGMVWERNRTTLDGFELPQMASVTGDPTYPADHLWLDYFWMPTAQPVDSGSPFATQGKVNMNYQLFPFT